MENCQPKKETQHTQFNYGPCYTNGLRGSGNARLQVIEEVIGLHLSHDYCAMRDRKCSESFVMMPMS